MSLEESEGWHLHEHYVYCFRKQSFSLLISAHFSSLLIGYFSVQLVNDSACLCCAFKKHIQKDGFSPQTSF